MTKIHFVEIGYTKDGEILRNSLDSLQSLSTNYLKQLTLSKHVYVFIVLIWSPPDEQTNGHHIQNNTPHTKSTYICITLLEQH